MPVLRVRGAVICSLMLAFGVACASSQRREGASIPSPTITIVGEAEIFAPGIVSTEFAEIRLTLSPDGRTALWFSRDRPGGAGGYDIWVSRRTKREWSRAEPVSFNSPARDFDPAFSSDGRYVYFCSDRPGGLGGDDIYRVRVEAAGFGQPEHLGRSVNSAGNEFAPMLSADRNRLLFSSDRPGGSGGHDLYTARRNGEHFAPARRLPGRINTAANEFDATFLSDNASIVFARAMDFRTDRVDLFVASPDGDHYDGGVMLPRTVNSDDGDTYGPMLDWSSPDRFTLSAQRDDAGSMDLYVVRYRLEGRHSTCGRTGSNSP